MESVLRNVADLDHAQRHWLETTLGRQLGDSQQVFIHVLTPGAAPSVSAKANALDDIQRLADQAADHRKAEGVSDAEAEAALDEAMRHVRPAASQ